LASKKEDRESVCFGRLTYMCAWKGLEEDSTPLEDFQPVFFPWLFQVAYYQAATFIVIFSKVQSVLPVILGSKAR